jgi:hypothetical protein
MRFTPIRVGQEIESCVTVGAGNAQGSVSQSLNLGGVNWDVYVYSSSQYLGGGGAEGFTFEIESGQTSHAIVAVVGGGGASSKDSRCGGGGALNYQTEVLLKEGGTYSISVGQGGDGTDRATPGVSFSGDDGNQSRFTGGGLDFTAGPGLGGDLAGNGGDSGNGNTSSGLGGAGAGAGTGANWGGVGRTVGLGNNSGSPTSNYVPIFRCGGGAGGRITTGPESGKAFGGGENTAGDGSPDAIINGTTCFGGGSGGGQYFDIPTSRYLSAAGASGCVMIAVPTNLCTGSLYVEKNVVRDNMKHYWDVTNARTIGKVASTTVVKDLRRITNLTHSTVRPLTSAETSSFYYFTDDKQINNFISDDTYLHLNRAFETNTEPGDYLSCSLDLDTTAEWSLDLIYETDNQSDPGDAVNPIMISGSQGAYISLLRDSSPETTRLRYVDGVNPAVDSVAVSTGVDKRQSVITYDGTDLKWYVDNVLEDTLTLSITSSLNNPDLYINHDQIGRTRGETKFSELRVYDTDLTTAQIEQNYSASFGL